MASYLVTIPCVEVPDESEHTVVEAKNPKEAALRSFGPMTVAARRTIGTLRCYEIHERLVIAVTQTGLQLYIFKL